MFKRIVPVERFPEYPKETFRIGGCGFGCVLVKTSVLKDVQMNYETCFLPLAGFGEDLAFCVRAQDLGYKLWCEPTVRCGHVGHIAIWPEDQERWKSEISNYDDFKGWW